MRDATADEPWLPNFRRALRFLRPHRRTLIMGLLAAAGVSLFYTFSISTVVPLLKIIFAEHEAFPDWLNRIETQHRLDVMVSPDLPDDPHGLEIDLVRPAARSRGLIAANERITAIEGAPVTSYRAARRIAEVDGERLPGVHIVAPDGSARDVALRLRPRPWWSRPAHAIVSMLPAGRTARQRVMTLAAVMAGMVLLSVLGGVCRFLNEGLVAAAVQRSMHDLRSRLADHVLRLPLDWHSTHPPGDVLGRFATDLSKVEVGASTLFGKVFREPLKAIGVLTLTLMIDWHLLLVALLGLPVAAILLHRFGRMVKRAQKSASASWGRLLDHLGERMAGIRVVKACNMESAEAARFEREGRELTRAQTHIEYVDAATNPALEVLAMIAAALFTVYGGSRVFSGELEPHLFFAAVVCLGGIFDPVRKMGNVNNRLQAAEASARRLFELLDIPAERREPEPSGVVALPAHTLAGATPQADPAAAGIATALESAARSAHARFVLHDSIRFEDVSFAYPSNPRRPVIDHVSLRIDKGRVVALVGPNGSGKTTLMALLMRFFDPTGGRIFIDERDIAGMPLSELRAGIGLVTQEAIVFSDTVRANIAYGANGVGLDSVIRAAQRAHADEFVRALRVEASGCEQAGYDAPVSARTLSGGQRQRIVLARAIVRDPPILILDEATSQIDTESERRIQEAIEDVTRDRTTIIIAHRFSTIARADLTVVLNEGRIVGIGRHAELLESCPFYVNLCETQFARGV